MSWAFGGARRVRVRCGRRRRSSSRSWSSALGVGVAHPWRSARTVVGVRGGVLGLARGKSVSGVRGARGRPPGAFARQRASAGSVREPASVSARSFVGRCSPGAPIYERTQFGAERSIRGVLTPIIGSQSTRTGPGRLVVNSSPRDDPDHDSAPNHPRPGAYGRHQAPRDATNTSLPSPAPEPRHAPPQQTARSATGAPHQPPRGTTTDNPRPPPADDKPQPASTGSNACNLTSVSASSAAGSESRTTPTPA
jgi:hypothetical protein